MTRRNDAPPAHRGAAPEMVDLVAAATMAPSMHNTQPWRFRYEPASETISLSADPARMLPVVIRMAGRCTSRAARHCSTSAWPPP